jgi:molybdenum-dependent DNA-binding transcriptional regulator ModE
MESERSLPHNVGRNNAQRHADVEKRKSIFLEAYEKEGTIRAACRAAKVDRSSYQRWHANDFDFAKALDGKKIFFAESLEELALERVRNPDKNRGSDVLLIGLLNANMPQKYRPQFAMSEDSAKELIIEWRKAAKDIKKETEEAPAELPNRVEDTLQEILEKRGSAPEKKEEE